MVGFLGVLVHWNSLSDPYSVFKYFVFAALCLGYSVGVRPQRGMLTITALAYIAALTLFAIIGGDSVSFIGRRLNYFSGVIPYLLLAICYHYTIGDDVKDAANSFLAACVIAALVSIAQSRSIYLPQGDFFGGRVYACMGNPVFLSGAMAMAVPLCLGRRHAPYALPLLFTTILLTQSRSGLVAAVAGCLGYLFHRGVIGWRMALALSLGFMLVTLGMFSGLRNTSKTDLGRYHMARIAIKAVIAKPLGYGPEVFGKVIAKHRDKALDSAMGEHWSNSYVHNSLLEALVIGGPIFLAIHLAFLAIVALFAYRHANSAVFGASCALLAFGLAQPTPLALKAALAAFLGASDPHGRPLTRTPFVLAAIVAFIASLLCVTTAKTHYNGIILGQAQMVQDSFKYQPSAQGD